MRRVLMFLALVAPVSGQDTQLEETYRVDLKKHAWAKWNPGSCVTIRHVYQGAEGVGAADWSSKVLKVEQKGYELQIKGSIHRGKTKAHEFYFRFDENEAGIGYMPSGARSVGTETLTIQRKEYRCVIWEGTFRHVPDNDGRDDPRLRQQQDEEEVPRRTARWWICKDVDLPLKYELGSGTGQFGASLEPQSRVAVELDAELQIAGTRLKCVKYEGAVKDGTTTIDGTYWYSTQVPGFTVKSTEHRTGPKKGQELTHECEVTEFAVK